MLSIRWRKILRDLWINDVRSLLAILAIVIGIFGSGSILSGYAILTREINVNFANTSPPSVTINTNNATQTLADDIASLPDVAAAEVRHVQSARILRDVDGWRPIRLFVIDNFDTMQIATFNSEEGAWPPADGEILLERSSVSLQSYPPGSIAVIQTPNGQISELEVSGIIHDAARAPGWQDNIDYAYMTRTTFEQFGETGTFNELNILVAENATDLVHITDVAYQVQDFVEAQGFTVNSVTIPTPGQHPHTDQMDSLLFLLEAFGVLTLILGGILVANVISALLAQQIRQIGAMKAIGGRTHQIAGLYFNTVLIYGIIALIIGIPLAITGGRAYASFTAELLNFNITSNLIPAWVYILLIMIGLSIPLIAAAIPIFRGSRITVREAISDYGIGEKQYGTSFIDILFSRYLRNMNRPLKLSLRNTFRRRVRLILIVGILAVGGATFMTAFNVNLSWSNTLDVAFEARNYDILVSFAEPYPIEFVEESIMSVSGVSQVESWARAFVVQEDANGTDGIRYLLSGLPSTTDMIDFPLLEGRWLRPDDTNALVITHELYYDEQANSRVGDIIPLRMGDSIIKWEVVGIVNEIGAPRRGLGGAATAYVNIDYFTSVMGLEAITNSVRIQTLEHSPEAQFAVSQRLEQQFSETGLRPTLVQASLTRLQILRDHLVVILVFLLLMAFLVASVGGLALTSVISINVMERAREIGIMRAIGASTQSILNIIITEGLIIGLMSWILAVLVAVPLSAAVGNYAGWIFLRSDLENIIAPGAVMVWLILVVITSIVASFYPAWNATRLTVREVVTYE